MNLTTTQFFGALKRRLEKVIAIAAMARGGITDDIIDVKDFTSTQSVENPKSHRRLHLPILL